LADSQLGAVRQQDDGVLRGDPHGDPVFQFEQCMGSGELGRGERKGRPFHRQQPTLRVAQPHRCPVDAFLRVGPWVNVLGRPPPDGALTEKRPQGTRQFRTSRRGLRCGREHPRRHVDQVMHVCSIGMDFETSAGLGRKDEILSGHHQGRLHQEFVYGAIGHDVDLH
jgi:hypothetical protein